MKTDTREKSRKRTQLCRFSGGSFIGICDYENNINFISTSNATSVVNRSSGNTINIGCTRVPEKFSPTLHVTRLTSKTESVTTVPHRVADTTNAGHRT